MRSDKRPHGVVPGGTGGGRGVLLLAAALLLPVSALFVEAISERSENWIGALQFVLAAGLGAATGAGLVPSRPSSAEQPSVGPHRSYRRRGEFAVTRSASLCVSS